MTHTDDRLAAPLAAAFDELVSRRLVPEVWQAVFIGGSMARGWANESSDVDLYVVVPTPWSSPTSSVITVPGTTGEVAVEVFRARGRRWEVKYWLDAQVDAILAKVGWDTMDDGSPAEFRLTRPEEFLLERIHHGAAVAGPEWLDRRRAQVEGSAVRALVVARELDHADGHAEDALGQLRAGDVDSAVLSARLAFGFAVEALLAACGEFGSPEKWRARRLRAARPDALTWETYWETETMRAFDPAEPGAWVRRVVSECKRITRAVEV